MVIRLLNLKQDKSKRLWLIVISALTIASILIGITMYIVLGPSSNSLNLKRDKEEIFDAISYKCGYNVTIISNKTINKYNFEKKKKKDEDGKEKFKFKTQNEIGDEINYLIDENNLKISSSSQINEYVLSDYVVRKTNILSLSTFISLYNDIKEYLKEVTDEKGVKIEIDEVDNTTCYRIIFANYTDEVLKEYDDIINEKNNIKKMELVLSNDTLNPLQYIVYNNQNKAYIDIEYSFFDINTNFN